MYSLCATAWPHSKEFGDLTAKPIKGAVTAEIEPWSEETPQVFNSVDAPTPKAETIS